MFAQTHKSKENCTLSTGFVLGFFAVLLQTLFLFVTCFLCVFCPDIKSSHEVEVPSVTFFWILATKSIHAVKEYQVPAVTFILDYCIKNYSYVCSIRVTTFIFMA
jgi:hypothetical protein